MARTSATISVGADTRQLERDIQRALGRDFKFKGLNERAFTQPLGRITGAANEFQKSLDASNARVIAFGASAGLIYSVERAFTALVKSTIDVQKSLTDINVILNVSNKTLQNFGGQLFDIAKNTAQSFDTVAQAATEFSRQGLGLEETLKRTRDALILTRLSGLDTVSAVEALTATINSFSNAALDSTTIINKLANVDAAFAVSSADLAEAIKRVGSSAQDVGVDFDQLLAIVTSVQQTTARGGAVIGNSLKTIFTRIQRTDTLDQLERLGIEVRTLQGDTLPAITILSNLASTFNTLSDSQRAQVAETVGGVFQINILKAALGDLQKEYSVYNNALRTASGATDEAIQRNEALNQTLSALINKTFVNLTKVGADIGRISFQPTFENLLNTLNRGLESLDVESQSVGGKIAKGILEGVGSFISGPGVVLATAVIGKLVINLAKFASQSLQTLLNLNTQAQQRAQIQTRINQVLAQEPALVAAVYNKQISVLDVENKILNIIRQQTLERTRAAAISTTIAGGLLTRGVSTKGGTLNAKSSGFIPNFAMSEIFGALAGGYNPGNIRRMNIPGEGPITYNSAEKVKRFPGLSQPAIMPPSQSIAGKNYKNTFDSIYGFNPYAADGFIPNFISNARIAAALRTGKMTPDQAAKLGYVKSDVKIAERKSLAASKKAVPLDVSNIASILLPFIGSSRILAGPFSPKGKSSEFAIRNIPVYGMKKSALEGDLADDKRRLFTNITNSILDNTTNFIDTLKPLGKTVNKSVLAGAFSSSGEKGAYGAVRAAVGSAFEIGVKTALNYTSLESAKGFGDFDVRGGKNLKTLQKLFGFTTLLADFKGGLSTGNLQSFAAKIYKERGMMGLGGFSTVKGKKAPNGFIPNFTALSESIDRELAAGVSPSRVRIGRDKRLTSAYNPLGLGVYNTKDEPLGLSQGVSRYSGSKAKTAGASKGFIPNFLVPLLGLGAAAGVGGTATVGSVATSILGSTIVRSVLSFALYTLIDKIGRRIVESVENERGKAITQAATSALSFGVSSLALGGGKKSFLTGAATGLGFGLLGSFDSLTKTQKEVIAASESNKDSLAEFSAAMTTYQTSIDKLSNSTLTDIERTRVLAEKEEALIDIFKETPAEFRDGLKAAIESGDLPRAIEELAKVQAALQSNATNTDNLSRILELTKGGINPDERENFAKALASFKNTSGTSLGMQVRQDPQMLETFRKEIEKAYVNADILANTKVFNEALKAAVEERFTKRDTKTGEIGYFVPPEERNAEEVKRITKEETDKLLAGKQARIEAGTRQNIINSLTNFLQKANIPKEVIDRTAADLQSVPFDQLGSSVEALIKLLEALGFKVKEVTNAKDEEKRITKEYILNLARQAGDVSASSANLEKFQGALSVENLTRYGKEVLNANEQLNPNRISAEKVLTLQEGLRTQILNETEQRGAEAKYIQRVNELLVKTGGDLDKFSKALEGSEQEIVLESQRRRGLIFAEDYRQGRQAARELRTLGGDTQIGDFGAAFFDEFDYRAEDAYREVQLGAKETARTIKSEFNNAFLDFAQGTTTAGEAFQKFALNISNKIQQLALEFSTNLIFGQLFGSTSAFGGSLGNFLSSLGKSKGGIIKGYSTGGKVAGGSGTKDDVPAMLSGGEYVIKKSSVNKYGTGFLGMLNGGRVGKYQYGGEGSFNKANYFQYTGPAGYPTGGQYMIDPTLNLSALLDENNPQNRIREQRAETLFAYLQYVQDVNMRNMEALAENQRINQEIQDQYNAQQNSWGAYASFGMGLAGAGLGFLRNGGHIKGFARGGQNTDNIPAMLMGGEFVMRKEAVNLYGKRFFDDLNTGRVSKFANGGVVGNSNNTGLSTNNYNPTNNVNVTVNLNQQIEKTSEETSTSGERLQDQEARKNKQLAEQIKTQVIRVITEQQRPGGLLGSNIYKKQG